MYILSRLMLRRAFLNLDGRVKTDPDLLLVWIRNAFATAGMIFPCFDLAFALAWAKTRGEEALPVFVNPWLGRLSKAAQGAVGEAASAGSSWLHGDSAKELLGDAVGHIPGVGFLIKHLGGWVIDKTKRAISERTYKSYSNLKKPQLKPAYELSALLPWMLAQDFGLTSTNASALFSSSTNTSACSMRPVRARAGGRIRSIATSVR